MQDYRHGCIAAHKAGLYPLYLANNLNEAETLEDLLPEHPQLHLGKAITHTAMQSKPEG